MKTVVVKLGGLQQRNAWSAGTEPMTEKPCHTRRMTSLREPGPHTVKLKQMYWLQEESKAKLLQLGAVCMDKVVDEHHYYDTAMYELARNQMWLSQRNQQWQLIMAHQKQEKQMNASKANVLHKATKQNSPSVVNGETYKSGNQEAESKDTIGDASSKQHTGSDFRKWDKPQSDMPSSVQVSADPVTEYCELVDEREIMTYLAQFLPTDMTGGGNMTMKEYLHLSGIQHYASYQTTIKETYKLLDTYIITIHIDELSSKKAAIVSMDSDVQSITRSFEDMENLANELKLQNQSA
ncbi:uncharacterized protein LOC115098002 [Rhinatrema bivittatum]|uniref:uncharacterized protein LOC115098002 n=1 Tax=Rhinatrema bivittatum TaxID=194408 RepID=UPI001125D6F6|nr:uncharacterized protein LOC115098002 [Rhinatrema bivittatum]